MNTERILHIALLLHIAGGTVSLLAGLVAMLTKKGGRPHRLAGKIYFGGMSTVFVTALALSLGHHRDFLLMVAFFSYYLTVRGYRILSLKKLHEGQKPAPLDWVITIVSGGFIVVLLGWGTLALLQGASMGIVALVFGGVGASFLTADVKSFFRAPKEKMHWWYGHISGMGGSYISAVTAFIVVNIQLPQHQWVLWVLPAAIGGTLITRTIRKYKVKFAPALK